MSTTTTTHRFTGAISVQTLTEVGAMSAAWCIFHESSADLCGGVVGMRRIPARSFGVPFTTPAMVCSAHFDLAHLAQARGWAG